ncbi:hypothetical protein PBY51_001704 [Eleginops maclovinus]|uniref:Uncharacterized protein n=1 Tax=Eleginops maclovinus TaxID=56733 RepID=A0AAN7WWJ6_ELEMC|nr:hypothetical protein PBY51_001704 [Eleginops maclovinus]
MGRQQRVSVCSCRAEGVGVRGQGGGREVPTDLFLLIILLKGAAPPAHLLSDPLHLEAPPAQELEDPQMKRDTKVGHF